MELVNNEQVLSHIVRQDSKLFSYLKDELVLSQRQTNSFMLEETLLVNNKAVKGNILLKKGDLIQLLFKDETNDYEQEHIPLDIIYESVDLLIINKPPHLLVHPTQSVLNHTLANGIAYYFKTIDLKRKIRFVNRLDMDTSGLIIVAKNAYSHQFLAKQFDDDRITKKYLTIIEGHLLNKAGKITAKIGKEEHTNKYGTDSNGKDSLTFYQVVKEYPNYSLIECIIKTGRTHQIRVHLGSLGAHILGDTFYHQASPSINRLALHAYSLSFVEPRTYQAKTIICDTPQDMQNLLY